MASYSVQTTDRRPGRLRICTVFSSDTWWHGILQLTERHASAFPRSSFAIICTIVEYSLPVSWSQSFLIFFKPRLVFSFSARVGWRDVFTEFTNLLKVDVDVNGATIEYLTCAIFEKFIFLTDMCSFCWQKCEPRPKLSFDLIYFQRSEVYTHWFSHMCLILSSVYMRNRRIFIGKSEALPSWLAIC